MRGTLIPGLPAASPWFAMNGGVNVIWDGNSLFAGMGASGPSGYTPAQAMALAPFSGAGAWTNLGISGQTWRQMNGLDGGSSADVDAAWDASRRNVLITWEGTNAVFNVGRTGLQAGGDAAAYFAARRAAHPQQWIVALTSLPRRGSTATCNELIAHDDYLRANWPSLGVDLLIDIRAEVPEFNFLGDSDGPFVATQIYWAESSFWIHPNDAGYALIAAAIARRIRRLPARHR
jgi:hypothetical protein